MKKLMVTIAAAAMSFGLFASDWATGTSFETLTGTAPLPLLTGYTDELSGDPAGYWDAAVTDTVQIVAYEAGEAKKEEARPEVFQAGFGTANYLKVKTAFNEPLNRYIQGDKSAKAVPETGLYYDGLVKMTAFDDDSASENLPNDTKIALWLQEGANEGDPTTLKLSAGEIGPEGLLSRKVYDLGAKLTADEWARVTIKTIGNISAETGTYIPGFIVFVDKEALTLSGVNFGNLKLTANAAEFKKANMLFPAYVADVSLEANSSLTSIGFAGQGGVDDISFRDEAPSDIDAAKDFTFFTLAWNENVATIDGVPVEGAGSRYELIADDKTYTYAYTAKDGFMDGTFTANEGEPEAGETYTIAPTALAATVTIGDVVTPCADLKTALDLIKDAGVDCTLKLGQDITEMQTVQNTAGKVVTIDLAGKKVSAIIATATTPVVVVDSVGGAVVSAGINGANVTIEAGTYEVALMPTAKLCGGRFSQEKYATAPTSSKTGWEFTAGTGEDAGYWVLTEKQITPITEGMITVQAVTYGDASITVTVTDGGTVLTEDTDYTLATDYTAATPAGECSVTVTGIGDYSGEVEKKFTVAKKALTGVSVAPVMLTVPFEQGKTAPGDYVKITHNGLDGIALTEYTGTWDNTEVTDKGGEFIYTLAPAENGNYTFEPAKLTLTSTAGTGATAVCDFEAIESSSYAEIGRQKGVIVTCPGWDYEDEGGTPSVTCTVSHPSVGAASYEATVELEDNDTTGGLTGNLSQPLYLEDQAGKPVTVIARSNSTRLQRYVATAGSGNFYVGGEGTIALLGSNLGHTGALGCAFEGGEIDFGDASNAANDFDFSRLSTLDATKGIILFKNKNPSVFPGQIIGSQAVKFTSVMEVGELNTFGAQINMTKNTTLNGGHFISYSNPSFNFVVDNLTLTLNGGEFSRPYTALTDYIDTAFVGIPLPHSVLMKGSHNNTSTVVMNGGDLYVIQNDSWGPRRFSLNGGALHLQTSPYKALPGTTAADPTVFALNGGEIVVSRKGQDDNVVQKIFEESDALVVKVGANGAKLTSEMTVVATPTA